MIGGAVYRHDAIKQLKDLLIFGDNPSGEIFYVHADKLPEGGQDAIRRILFDQNGESKTLLQLIQDKNVKQGKPAAPRADLRFGYGPNGQLFILNKRDGTIRLLVPDGSRPSSGLGGNSSTPNFQLPRENRSYDPGESRRDYRLSRLHPGGATDFPLEVGSWELGINGVRDV